MRRRLELQALLEGLLGSKNVYFQPPATVRMQYPAIVYSRSRIEDEFANNLVYKRAIAYEITVIDKNPDSEIVEKVSFLPLCKHGRHYTADGFNHDVFTLYY